MVVSSKKISASSLGGIPLSAAYMVIKFNEDGEGKEVPYIFTNKAKATKYASEYEKLHNCDTEVYSLKWMLINGPWE